MSMNDTENYDDEATEEAQDNLRELRQAAKSGKAAIGEAEALRRELAFSKAGIDTDSPKGKMFVKAYDGELDTAQIKGQFEELFGAGDSDTTETDAQTAEAAARAEELKQQTQDRRDLTSQGTDFTPQPEGSLIDAGYKRMQDALNDGRPMEIAFREALGGTLAAANAGDPRAVWTGWTDEQMEGWS